MPTATAAATATAAHFLFGRQTSEFEGLIDVLMDRLLDLVQFFLRVHEIPGHGVLHQAFAMLLEVSNLLSGQRDSHLLLLLQRLAFVNEAVVLGARLFVAHERVDALANRLHVGLVQDGLAELTGFLHYRRFFDRRLHNLFRFKTIRGHLCL